MAGAVKDSAHHRYPDNRGGAAFRRAAAEFMLRHYGVTLDPDTEVLALIGSKEGIGHLPAALAGPGDAVLTPDPGYPPYTSGAVLAGARPVPFLLREDAGFLPDFSQGPFRRLRRARILFLNYPNNPTGATATAEVFSSALAWARARGCWVAHDAAYAETFYDGRRPPSLLQNAEGMERGIEFHSLSKTFNMTGWRVAWACGSARAIAALAKVKSHLDSGVFTAVQHAAGVALARGEQAIAAMRALQGRRRRLFTEGLDRIGWKVFRSPATFYVWCRAPEGASSARCAERLLEEAGIVASPGSGFGSGGEGFIRFALTVPEERLEAALGRIARLKW